MEFQNKTAEELLSMLPPDEDDLWELKSAKLLEPSNKGELKKELGKQVSAFANSGGGYIVFGVGDKTRVLEACPDKVGRQPMGDYLSNMVEQSVDYPVSNYQIFRMAFDSDSSKGIYLIRIEDSPAAPHQAKDERQYYYRIFGHSKPAPHFHLELLRQRQTKCIVVPKIESVVAAMPGLVRRKNALTYDVIVSVENQASFVAQPVGISISCSLPTENWSIGNSESDNAERVITEEYLFPGLTSKFRFKITYSTPRDEPVPVDAIVTDLPDVKISIRAFSQNYGSEAVEFVLTDYSSSEEIIEANAANEKSKAKFAENMKKKFEEIQPRLEAGMREAKRMTSKLPPFKNPDSE